MHWVNVQKNCQFGRGQLPSKHDFSLTNYLHSWCELFVTSRLQRWWKSLTLNWFVVTYLDWNCVFCCSRHKHHTRNLKISLKLNCHYAAFVLYFCRTLITIVLYLYWVPLHLYCISVEFVWNVYCIYLELVLHLYCICFVLYCISVEFVLCEADTWSSGLCDSSMKV